MELEHTGRFAICVISFCCIVLFFFLLLTCKYLKCVCGAWVLEKNYSDNNFLIWHEVEDKLTLLSK